MPSPVATIALSMLKYIFKRLSLITNVWKKEYRYLIYLRSVTDKFHTRIYFMLISIINQFNDQTVQTE